jgi:hypothetical protein
MTRPKIPNQVVTPSLVYSDESTSTIFVHEKKTKATISTAPRKERRFIDFVSKFGFDQSVFPIALKSGSNVLRSIMLIFKGLIIMFVYV